MQFSTLAILLPIVAVSAATPLKVIKTSRTADGFSTPPRGFNTYGLNANGAIESSFKFDQSHVLTQAKALHNLVPSSQLQSGDYYISLDSGWSVGDHGDDNGRIIYDTNAFNITDLASQLHGMDLKMGVYILPGAFCNDANKIIAGTNTSISAILSGNNNGFARCDFDFSKDGVQQWHNSVINLFAQW
jgi:alpha-galactosidase